MNYKKSIENIEPYKPGLSEKDIKLKYNLEKVVKLASNENPYGPSDKVKDINLDSIERYPDNVTVYFIGDISSELCGGPHVKNTKELGHFKIKKEESSSAGVRRIKAVLE